MLIGEFEHTIDLKNRVILPSKLREDIGTNFIITKGLDNCLFIFLKIEWKKFEEKLKNLPLVNKNSRDFVRFFLSGATEYDLDKQGRFLLSNTLKEYAKLNKEIIIIGVGTRAEIWDKETWKQYKSNDNISPETIAENMSELGMLGI